ncbi:hypothetical protein [Streptomyces halobius]|uniref:ParB-like nuclease family protein n=1 Tax=Streptomyces halobius TaxID=2879846 RepID=A0ABY4MD83_9ACTN|nr:hypothetical protein [Streptomyces halobius]UQA95640.1 hypothetical protein K9S39_30630 [Streptomyces halobius]
MSQATYVRTDTIPLTQLTPFPGNAKRGDVGAILNSLCRNGQYRSLVVRSVEPDRYVILTGNHTTQALAAHGPGDCGLTVKVGEEERPCGVCGNQPWDPVARCEVVQCDEGTARRINLVDNRAADLGTYDEQALAELIAGLDDDLGGTGYTDEDLADLLTAIEEAADEEEPPAPAGTGPAATPGAPDTVSSPAAAADSAPPAPPPPGHVIMTLTYLPADRDEAARLVSAAREVFPGEAAPAIVLRALRALTAVLDSRHSHDGVVTAPALLKAAGIQPS